VYHTRSPRSGPLEKFTSPTLWAQTGDYRMRDAFEKRSPSVICCRRPRQERGHNYRMAVGPRQNPDVIERRGHAVQCVRSPTFVRETNSRRYSGSQTIGHCLVVQKIEKKSRRWA
jgi:hypothetical protein